MKRFYCLLYLFFYLASSSFSQTTFISYGSSWKYFDKGTSPGSTWKRITYNDSAWSTGMAQLGYGDGDESTIISYGNNAANKYITTYCRKAISVSNAAAYTGFVLNIKRDDGAVVYVNGIERFRTNMPVGNIYNTTKASSEPADDGNIPQSIQLPAGLLVNGTNVVAVEIHQRSISGPDISFDLELKGYDTAAPAIQSFSPADNASNISASSNLVLSFNERVKKGAGNIFIYENGLLAQTINVTSGSVAVSGNKVTINPSDFANGAKVYVLIPAGVFKDLANNIFAGIIDSTAFNFSVYFSDIIPPSVVSLSPADNAVNVPFNGNLVLYFSENVYKGSGQIIIRENGLISQTLDVNSAAVAISGSLATINAGDFGYNKFVSVEIGTGVFKDSANNFYTGISDTISWNFQTEEIITSPVTFITFGDNWKYLDNGSDQDTAWRTSSFNDNAWPTGWAQFGYGEGDETTVISYGSNANAKYITTYFRKVLMVNNPSAFAYFAGSVKRDDGIVVYINGKEVYRNNMPSGAINYTTLASGAASDDGQAIQQFSVNSAYFTRGNNLIAVEIHQTSGSSSDVSFDLQLIGTVPGAAILTRGPYMNSALQDGIVIRWRTDIATDSKVKYGTSSGSLTESVTDNTLTTEHEITLTGLAQNTMYYYSIGSASQTLQGDANNYFKTMPPTGSTQKIRVLAMGDMGNNSTNQVNVRNAWLTFNGNNYTDAWILLGDNAYSSGTDAEYQSNFYNIYQGSLTKNHVLWPAPGNHDYANNSSRQADHAIPYYDMFTLPKNGQAGGVASNTEAYYSYNYGNVHFIALDSYGWESGNTRLYDTLGPQALWLKQDLSSNTQPWTVVYFHHPPYTKGSHNSDNETELINMRQRIVPIFERYKVDLVLNGHSHSYERSYLINGHYGLESTFSFASHAISSSSGRYDGSGNACTYIKNTNDSRNGIVFAVVGSAGQLGGTTPGYPHNAMSYSNETVGGALYFEVENNRLNAKWIGADGLIRDYFTLMKNVNKTSTINISAGQSVNLAASWLGNYYWSTGATTASVMVAPANSTTYTVTDGAGCITDVFQVNVSGPRFRYSEIANGGAIKLYPNVIHRGQEVRLMTSLQPDVKQVQLYDEKGRWYTSLTMSNSMRLSTRQLPAGSYVLKFIGDKEIRVKKLVVLP